MKLLEWQVSAINLYRGWGGGRGRKHKRSKKKRRRKESRCGIAVVLVMFREKFPPGEPRPFPTLGSCVKVGVIGVIYAYGRKSGQQTKLKLSYKKMIRG